MTAHTATQATPTDERTPDADAVDWQRRPTVPVDVAAELLGISRASAFRAVHRGQLPSIRLGRRIVIPTAGLLALLGIDG
jgi:excisionase family DNA binding protein